MVASKDMQINSVALHPGEVILGILKERGMSQVELAVRLGMQKSYVNEIIKGKRGLNADIAVSLEYVLGSNAYYWLGLQMNYDLKLAYKTRLTP